MSASSLSYNPVGTTNAAGSFNVTSDGYTAGTALDDPAIRYQLAGGTLGSAETLPMWGGIGISEYVPGAASTPQPELGGTIHRATNYTDAAALSLTGWSVFDQNYSAVQTPTSEVPVSLIGMQVNFYRLKSGARLVLPCSPNLVNLEGAVITSRLLWDFTNQLLTPYSSTTISSGTYNTGTGAVALTTAAPHGLNPGDTFYQSGTTGTGSFANLNGWHTAVAGTTASTINYVAATGLTLTISGGNIGYSAALPVQLLDVNIGNSMVPEYSSVDGSVNWNRSGNVAVIRI